MVCGNFLRISSVCELGDFVLRERERERGEEEEEEEEDQQQQQQQ